MLFEVVTSAFLVGLLGAGHCLGMCGGIIAALSFGVSENDSQRFRIILFYNIGRIFSYACMGFLVGFLGQTLQESFAGHTAFPFFRVFAGVMLVLMGFYVSGWWKVLSILERVGSQVWKLLHPVSQKLLPVQNLRMALLAGGVWGWLPCGLVYSALVFAAAQGNAVDSMTVMAAFGLGTLPAVFLGGVASERMKALLQQRTFRSISGLCLIGFGVWTMFVALTHVGHQHHGEHESPAGDHQHHHMEHQHH